MVQHKKKPKVYRLTKMKMSSSTQTDNKVEIIGDKDEKKSSYIILVQADFHQGSVMISNFSEEQFSEEDDDISEEKIAL